MSLPRDNVVPIDDAAALVLTRRRTRFRWFVAALGAVWLSALVPVLVLTPLPPLVPFLVMAGLMILAEHRFILFDDETSMSASIIVGVASVFVFADTSPLAGPMLVASTGGIFLPLVRRREFAVSIANGAAFGISALVSCASVLALPTLDQQRTEWFLLSAACASTYWLVNGLIVGWASAARNTTPRSETVAEQIRSDWPMLILTIAAGIAAQVGAAGSLVLVVMLIGVLLATFEARIAFVHRARRIDAPLAVPYVGSGLALLAAALLAGSDSSLGLAAACVALFVACFLGTWHGESPRSFAPPLCLGALLVQALTWAGVPPLTTLIATSLVLGSFRLVTTEVGSEGSNGARMHWIVALGLAIPSRRELAVWIVTAGLVWVLISKAPMTSVTFCLLTLGMAAMLLHSHEQALPKGANPEVASTISARGSLGSASR